MYVFRSDSSIKLYLISISVIKDVIIINLPKLLILVNRTYVMYLWCNYYISKYDDKLKSVANGQNL